MGWIILAGLIIVLVIVGVLFIVLNFLKKQWREESKFSREQLLQLAGQHFESEQNKAVKELETRKQAIEGSVQGLKEQLDDYKRMMHEFEKDRTQKYGNLETRLKDINDINARLQESTNQLNNILGNVKLRGQWGERVADDIITYAGLIEGVNYIKQKATETSTRRPDFTFLLPNNAKINMDVKFPLDNYTRMVNTENVSEKETFRKEFIKNIKDRVREIQDREYINPADNTLDFVLLFIPNEQVYSLIQEKMPGFIDEALKQKVVLCSPFTLYAMLSVIRQAYENFRYEKGVKKIIELIDQFAKIYSTFKDRFDIIGDSIVKLETQYNDLKGKSFKQMDTKIRHIDNYKKGNMAALEKSDEVIDAETLDDTFVQ
jgi:DNA recombination protein RmuC